MFPDRGLEADNLWDALPTTPPKPLPLDWTLLGGLGQAKRTSLLVLPSSGLIAPEHRGRDGVRMRAPSYRMRVCVSGGVHTRSFIADDLPGGPVARTLGFLMIPFNPWSGN